MNTLDKKLADAFAAIEATRAAMTAAAAEQHRGEFAIHKLREANKKLLHTATTYAKRKLRGITGGISNKELFVDAYSHV